MLDGHFAGLILECLDPLYACDPGYARTVNTQRSSKRTQLTGLGSEPKLLFDALRARSWSVSVDKLVRVL